MEFMADPKHPLGPSVLRIDPRHKGRLLGCLLGDELSDPKLVAAALNQAFAWGREAQMADIRKMLGIDR